MNNRYRYSRTAAAIVLAAVVVPATAAPSGRVLVGHDDARARIAEDYACAAEIPVSVESDDPELFGDDPSRMQSISDSVQAILRHECARLQAVRISGYLRGLDQPVYAATASGDDQWRLTPQRTLRSKDLSGAAPLEDDLVGDVVDGRITLARLRLGMGVDDVSQGIADEFGREPAYDPMDGVASLRRGGCPDGKPGTDWTCIEAHFTDRRVPQLFRLDYVQVVEGDLADVRHALIENFDEPVNERRDGDGNPRRMTWERSAGSGVAGEILEAALTAVDDVVVVELVLRDARTDAPGAVTRFHQDVDLRL